MFFIPSIAIYDRWMELQQLRYVVAVAETNSFTQAARQCLVVQSALSHQIARLERELGTRLFERTSRRVRLTPAGTAFLPAARQCLDAAERAAAEAAAAVGEIRGRLAVGLIPTVAAVDIPGALRTFREQHPNVRISLRVGASEDLVEQVKDGTIEVAFLGLPTTAHPTGVEARELARDRLVAVVAPDHPLAGRAKVTLRRLSEKSSSTYRPEPPAARRPIRPSMPPVSRAMSPTKSPRRTSWPDWSKQGSASACSPPATYPN